MRNGKRIKYNFASLILDGDFGEDIRLEPNDIVFLPNIKDNKVYVVGAVNEPKYVYYRTGLKVLDAILEAGGFNEFANTGNVVIIRERTHPNGDKSKIELQADIKALLKGKDLRQNLLLLPGDYVNVKEGMF
jgi:polysaccharide export outer membrane protein